MRAVQYLAPPPLSEIETLSTADSPGTPGWWLECVKVPVHSPHMGVCPPVTSSTAQVLQLMRHAWASPVSGHLQSLGKAARLTLICWMTEGASSGRSMYDKLSLPVALQSLSFLRSFSGSMAAGLGAYARSRVPQRPSVCPACVQGCLLSQCVTAGHQTFGEWRHAVGGWLECSRCAKVFVLCTQGSLPTSTRGARETWSTSFSALFCSQ